MHDASDTARVGAVSTAGDDRPGHRLSGRLATIVTRLTVLLVVWGAPIAAWAQSAAAPPEPKLRRSTPAWIGFMAIFVLATIVVAVSVIPSKRGHQD